MDKKEIIILYKKQTLKRIVTKLYNNIQIKNNYIIHLLLI